MESEERLFEQCRNGEKDAFFKLVEPLLGRVYSTSTAILRSTHLAEDAVQNTLIEAYQAIIKGKKNKEFQILVQSFGSLPGIGSGQTKVPARQCFGKYRRSGASGRT